MIQYALVAGCAILFWDSKRRDSRHRDKLGKCSQMHNTVQLYFLVFSFLFGLQNIVPVKKSRKLAETALFYFR